MKASTGIQRQKPKDNTRRYYRRSATTDFILDLYFKFKAVLGCRQALLDVGPKIPAKFSGLPDFRDRCSVAS